MINIYCDESCHLQNDESDLMVLGAISISSEKKEDVIKKIRVIKSSFNISEKNELKWTKVSKSKVEMYKNLIDLFFDEDLSFRVLIAHDKHKLKFTENDGYNKWYYKMYFILLDKIIDNPDKKYRIFLDVKDTAGTPRVEFLHQVLCNNIYDFNRDVIDGIFQIDSSRNDLVQLCDILIGIFSYERRGINKSIVKNEIVEHFKMKAGVKFYGTYPSESKLNVFDWRAR